MVLGSHKASDGLFVPSMPYSGHTRAPCSNVEDTGMAIGEVVRCGDKSLGRPVVLFGGPIPEEERLKIWADGKFFVTFEVLQHAKRLSSYRLPPDAVVASTELVEALPHGKRILMSERQVQTEEVKVMYLSDGYKLATWADHVRKEDWSSLIGASTTWG
ncbi:hypothetical protein EAE96_001233 [Botrytis aclada]|nr:hypothetical protein EAE96_001233 [Botrytis aclada]